MNSRLSKSNLNIRDTCLSPPKPPTNGLPRRSESIKQLFKFSKNNQENRIYHQKSNFKYSQLNKYLKGNQNLLYKKNLNSLKAMSHSVSDLREFHSSKLNDEQEHVKDEIQERRHAMYIAEIEMESLLRIGPTLK